MKQTKNKVKMKKKKIIIGCSIGAGVVAATAIAVPCAILLNGFSFPKTWRFENVGAKFDNGFVEVNDEHSLTFDLSVEQPNTSEFMTSISFDKSLKNNLEGSIVMDASTGAMEIHGSVSGTIGFITEEKFTKDLLACNTIGDLMKIKDSFDDGFSVEISPLGTEALANDVMQTMQDTTPINNKINIPLSDRIQTPIYESGGAIEEFINEEPDDLVILLLHCSIKNKYVTLTSESHDTITNAQSTKISWKVYSEHMKINYKNS